MQNVSVSQKVSYAGPGTSSAGSGTEYVLLERRLVSLEAALSLKGTGKGLHSAASFEARLWGL